mmetsp:Transcript_24591/g.52158  ORF Transcript_24591/g.52158 Transcript_24591/m.52158 type:complete len:289 (-) Transcript_24591:1962-2828(-)
MRSINQSLVAIASALLPCCLRNTDAFLAKSVLPVSSTNNSFCIRLISTSIDTSNTSLNRRHHPTTISLSSKHSQKMVVGLSRKEDASSGEILMLSGYPFYVNGPDPKEVAKVAEKVGDKLKSVLGEELISVDRMGSSAIDGLAGTPVCDILAQVSSWPISEENKQRLDKVGVSFEGKPPHDEQDEWFFGGIDEDTQPGHLGRFIIHTVPKGSKFAMHMRAFVEYVNSHPDAFQRYNDVKVEGARLSLAEGKPEDDGKLISYKRKKEEVCNKVKAEAIEWWEASQQQET